MTDKHSGPQSGSRPSRRKRLLIAEPEPATRDWLRPIAAELDADLFEAASGLELQLLLNRQGPFDLVIVNDVLHYLPTAIVRRGLITVAPYVNGLLFAPTFTPRDQITGDRVDFQQRSADSYRRAFAQAGLRQVGPWAWTPRDRYEELAELERP